MYHCICRNMYPSLSVRYSMMFDCQVFHDVRSMNFRSASKQKNSDFVVQTLICSWCYIFINRGCCVLTFAYLHLLTYISDHQCNRGIVTVWHQTCLSYSMTHPFAAPAAYVELDRTARSETIEHVRNGYRVQRSIAIHSKELTSFSDIVFVTPETSFDS